MSWSWLDQLRSVIVFQFKLDISAGSYINNNNNKIIWSLEMESNETVIYKTGETPGPRHLHEHLFWGAEVEKWGWWRFVRPWGGGCGSEGADSRTHFCKWHHIYWYTQSVDNSSGNCFHKSCSTGLRPSWTQSVWCSRFHIKTWFWCMAYACTAWTVSVPRSTRQKCYNTYLYL